MIIRLLRTFVLPVVAIGAALLVGMLFLAATGYPALGTFRDIFVSCFRDWYGFGQVLRETTLLTFTGLAVALGFRAGLFNIGAEGQLCIGALAVGIAGHYVRQINPHTLQAIPWAAWVALFIGIAFLAGGIWGGIPGVLKATTGAHEVITTMMMNFIAFSVVSYMLRAQPDSFAAPESRHTYPVPQYVRIPRLGAAFHVFQGSVASYTVLLALVSAVVVFLMLRYTRLGYGIRAVGYNPVAARLAGISPGRITVIAMFLSGGLSGLVGVDYVLGYKGYFEEGFSAGLGFLGIAVALLANNNPLGVLVTAFLFAVLNYGKVAAAGKVPKDIIEIMEAAIIFSMLVGNRLFTLALRHYGRRAPAAQPAPATI